MRNLLRRLCGDRNRADDLAQQAFLQAWHSIRVLRATDAFGGWLRQIAVRTWLQEARKAMIATIALEDAEQLPKIGAQSGTARIDLDRALARLKSAERLCIVLAYHEGMSHSEIANATNWPLGTVKSHIARGAERLRELLAAYGEAQ